MTKHTARCGAILAATILAITSFAAPAAACDCIYPRPFEDEARALPLVVHVRVHVTAAGKERAVTFEVLRVLKGSATTSLLPLDWPRGADCDHSPGEFTEGQEIVLALKDEGGPLGVRLSGCRAILAKIQGDAIEPRPGAALTLDELERTLRAPR